MTLGFGFRFFWTLGCSGRGLEGLEVFRGFRVWQLRVLGLQGFIRAFKGLQGLIRVYQAFMFFGRVRGGFGVLGLQGCRPGIFTA